MNETRHRVLVLKERRAEGAGVVEIWEYEDCTSVQALAYASGDPAWRSAKAATSSWFGRAWRRVWTGVDA